MRSGDWTPEQIINRIRREGFVADAIHVWGDVPISHDLLEKIARKAVGYPAIPGDV
jgi:hypothetical protein